MTDDNDIKRTEGFLRNLQIINSDKTFSDFILSPVEQSIKTVEEVYQYLKDNQGGGVILRIPVLVAFSGACFDTEMLTENFLIKVNAAKLRDFTNKLIIKELSPYILMFFRWDLDRRAWKNPDDEYKISYLKKLMADLDDELQGKSQIVKKYVRLLIGFGLSKFNDIASKVKPNEIPNSAKTLESIRNLETLISTDKLDDAIDDEVENSFTEMYVPIAQNYINGLLQMSNKYDFLLYAFIEAQNDYRKLVSNLMIPSINTDIGKIRQALFDEDVSAAISILRSFFATIPNQLYGKQNEAIYHISFHIILKLMGCDIKSQISTSDGIIDAVIEFPHITYIVEIKLTDSDAALTQIKEKEYYLSFRQKNKTLFLLGISFDRSKRNINEKYSSEVIME